MCSLDTTASSAVGPGGPWCEGRWLAVEAAVAFVIAWMTLPEEAEEEQEAVVDAILNGILGEKMAVAGSSPASAPQMAARPAAAAEEEAPAEEEEDDISEMQARIAALRAA